MRLCRVKLPGSLGEQTAFFFDQAVLPLSWAAEHFAQASGQALSLPENGDVLSLLCPGGEHFEPARLVFQFLERVPPEELSSWCVPLGEVELGLPVPLPNKLFLLAGNYAEHVQEGGEQAAGREQTFPYVFMKPPSTTLVPSGQTVHLPRGWTQGVDYELELGVVIGRQGRYIPESEALDYVAGYTIINDLSHRQFRPNPQRVSRPRDAFFDWLHGKWFDGFCPCGPCVTSAAWIPDPQNLHMELRLNGQVRQQASTAQQIFPVAAVVSFISQIVTLEPGDVISTGTPSGVGKAQGTFLQPGDRLEATIEGIGTLVTLIGPAG